MGRLKMYQQFEVTKSVLSGSYTVSFKLSETSIVFASSPYKAIAELLAQQLNDAYALHGMLEEVLTDCGITKSVRQEIFRAIEQGATCEGGR